MSITLPRVLHYNFCRTSGLTNPDDTYKCFRCVNIRDRCYAAHYPQVQPLGYLETVSDLFSKRNKTSINEIT